MGRRLKTDRPAALWADEGSLEEYLFGSEQNLIDEHKWLHWFVGPPTSELSRSFDRLVVAGCDRSLLGRWLATVHLSELRPRCSREDLVRAMRAIERCSQELEALSGTEIAPLVGLESYRYDADAPFSGLVTELWSFHRRLKQLRFVPSRKSNQMQQQLIARLTRYAMWATGRRYDAELTVLLKDILGPDFNMTRWRRDYRDLWDEPNPFEERLDAAVKAGKIRPPQHKRSRRPPMIRASRSSSSRT